MDKPLVDFTITDKKRGYRYPHCKLCVSTKKREDRAANRDEYNAYQREYFARNKERMLPMYAKANLAAYYRLKDELFNLLGGKCARCDQHNWNVLQIDHTEGGGGEDRKNGHTKSYRRMRDELRAGTDEGRYQLLCANCHHLKTTASVIWRSGRKRYS